MHFLALFLQSGNVLNLLGRIELTWVLVDEWKSWKLVGGQRVHNRVARDGLFVGMYLAK